VKHDKRPLLPDQEQALVAGVQVRLIQPDERPRFDYLISTEHYLHKAEMVGEQLRYVAEYEGQWVALLSWSAAAYHLKLREAWIGWSRQQLQRRLPLAVNNSRFLIRPAFQVPNLASRVMKLCLQRLAPDWQARYGHAVLVAESFVDLEQHLGTCYKASGWTLLGQTQGYERRRRDFYLAHHRPKDLWVRELREGARTLLRGRNLPEALRAVEHGHPAICHQEPAQLRQMQQFFNGLKDWRTGACDYSVATLVTLTVCALLAGVGLGQRDLAAFAANLTVAQMAALGLPRAGRPRRYRVPGETTFFRLLSNLDSRALERALLDWQNHVLGQRDPAGDRVAVDGKELLNSQGMAIVSAYSVRDGRWLGSEAVAAGSNEIPAAQTLLRRLDLNGSLVTADAMHTQTETARIIVQECGGDYLFTVKRNQKGVAKNVQQLYQGLLRDFSPSA
jgi:hypothetical protein